MEKLIVKLCASNDSFGAYAENTSGIYGAGDTVEQCKKDILLSIEQIKKNLPEEQWPDIIKGEYEIEWHYDTQSLLLYYGSIMSLSGIENITGIHQKQLWSYMHGRSKPRQAQKKRLETSLHAFGTELSKMAVY